MKKYFCGAGWVAYFFLMSCESRTPIQQKEISAPTIGITEPPQPFPPSVDTLRFTQEPYKRGEYSYQRSQKEFKAGPDTYKAITEGYSLNDSSLTEIQRDSAEGKLTRVRVIKAHNHVYSITLTKNGKTLYSKKFTKHDFLKLENDGFIIESVPMAPEFRGVTQEGRVLFDIWFGLPASDFGGISYFSTDLKGNLLQLESYSSTGGNGCDGQVHTNPNRKYFLTCHTLYGPNGYAFKFGKPDMVTARFLSDTSFFALYNYVKWTFTKDKQEWDALYDRTTKNLIFYHVNGSQLASYRYDGFYNELDYAVPTFTVEEVGRLYLLDEETTTIHAYSTSDPRQSQRIPFQSLQKLWNRPKDKKWKEVALEQTFFGKKYSFYFSGDTLKAYFVKESF
ncbi:hypothetical protein ACD591_11310 [Rufibacter glacialis]|uniref:Uncharacterized protein n=1 Tax=Rufibacter glacialis TaxID=1259555 RepID=A0A5M8Q989_9BACT|nr:hypothetical protein [Rufibacter glacialis]KAA6431661.1 hypothetical protein FOE74_16185 [Rufibacter glacialis]GGK82612.1 hypothetical protein GCM10011405_33000 [Rufibacter glacialis]